MCTGNLQIEKTRSCTDQMPESLKRSLLLLDEGSPQFISKAGSDYLKTSRLEYVHLCTSKPEALTTTLDKTGDIW